MTNKYQEPAKNMTERIDRQKADGYLTKQDIDDINMSLSAANRHLDVLIEMELPAGALRHIALVNSEISKARLSAKNAEYRLKLGK